MIPAPGSLAYLLDPCAECPHDYGDHLKDGPCAHEDCDRFTPACRECGTPLTLDLSIRNGLCDDHAPGGVM